MPPCVKGIAKYGDEWRWLSGDVVRIMRKDTEFGIVGLNNLIS